MGASNWIKIHNSNIPTFALDDKPRKLSRAEESICKASWLLDLFLLHFIATRIETQRKRPPKQKHITSTAIILKQQQLFRSTLISSILTVWMQYSFLGYSKRTPSNFGKIPLKPVTLLLKESFLNTYYSTVYFYWVYIQLPILEMLAWHWQSNVIIWELKWITDAFTLEL